MTVSSERVSRERGADRVGVADREAGERAHDDGGQESADLGG